MEDITAESYESASGARISQRYYIGTKETLAYTFFKVSKGFTIDGYAERFIFDILHVDFTYLAIVSTIGGIWDVINDTLIGALVDKTRTRWGKFKPYLFTFAIPGTIGACLFWMMPLFFPGRDALDLSKFIVYFALAVARETAGTFSEVAQTGMLATITPNPDDRARLITLSGFLSNFLGDGIPQIIMPILIDAVNLQKIKIKMQSAYIFMGVSTSLIVGFVALFFASVTRERVMQSVERPSVMDGIKSILNNKPVLLMTLSDFLSSFSVGTGMSNYYIDVLGMASIMLIVGVPGVFVTPVSYSFVPWFRRKFSTKLNWMIGSYTGDFLMALVFFFGSIGGKKNGLYKRKGPMIAAIMLQETLFCTVMGLRHVIPTEMYNEALDYCEWKNGYRTEGMTSVARGLAAKLVRVIGAAIRSILMKAFGYEQGAGFLKQTDSTKYFLFAMSTIIPFVTGSLGIIPKLFYDLSGKKRDLMYEELALRRAQTAAKVGTSQIAEE
jgi:Na+/melibiose symporter-like transporter